MKSRRATFTLALVGVVALFGLWVFLAPTKLGGSTTYSITDGISMKPLLVKNDLALVRTASNYRVGNIVLYQSQVLHRPVLHRIILIQNGNYFFKGDNNDFVDHGYATRSELVGKLWIHVPWVGSVLGWFAKPFHAALLAGSAAMVIVMTGTTTTTRRRRRHRLSAPRAIVPVTFDPKKTAMTLNGSPSQERRSRDTPRDPDRERRSGIEMTARQVRTRHPPSFLEGAPVTLAVIGFLALVAPLFLGFGFSRPLQRAVPLVGAFQQTGSFSYSATVKEPTAVYPSGSAVTGDPIYPTLVNTVVMQFKYRFTFPLVHNIKGTIELRALLLSQANTWQQLTLVQPSTAFTGDSTSLVSSLPLAGLYDLIDTVSTQSGTSGAAYSADIQPIVEITGTVGNQSIKETFSPVLPFTVAPAAITLNAAVTAAPPGATYVTPSASTALSSTLNPTQAGNISHLVSNVVPVAKYEVPVPLLRVLGIVCGGLALAVALTHDFLRRRKSVRSDEEQIATRSHTLLVPVASLAPPAGIELIELPGFASLASLAQFLKRPILYATNGDERSYAVDDEYRRYLYRAVDEPDAEEGLAQPDRRAGGPPPSRSSGHAGSRGHAGSNGHAPSHAVHRSRGWVATRVAAGLVALGVTATLMTSFTASTNVPTSKAGTSIQARLVSQLAPIGCSSPSLGSVVNGSGKFSNSRSNTLVLGSATSDTITDTGTKNCIVGGGGTDAVTGTATDICVTGPTLGTAQKCPVASGVTATPSSDNYNNYGGQERLTITNVSSITALTIKIYVAQPTGLAYSSESNSFPGGALTQTSSTSGGVILYTSVLISGQTIAAGSSGIIYAQFSGTGSVRTTQGDTWIVTSTSGGITSTLTGTF
jgi:signal peptidase I